MANWKTVPDETPIDASGLIPGEIRTREQLNVAEAENIHQAVEKYLAAKPTRRQAPFSLAWTYRLHREMFGEVWAWAGRRRQRDLNIGIAHHQIDVVLESLLRDLALWREKAVFPMSEQAVRLHHRSVLIHPFENGNGRWARLLANIWLRQNSHPLVIWPDQVIGRESTIRQEYIAAIKAADNHNYASLVKLHEKFTASESILGSTKRPGQSGR